MKFSWMFGPTLEQHHLLWAYLLVWLIQGGYAAWIGYQLFRTRRKPHITASLDSSNEP